MGSRLPRAFRPVVRNERGLAALEAASYSDVKQAAAGRSIHVRVDPRVELFSILARLAGFAEYSQAPDYAYTRAVDSHFAAFAGHPAVASMRSLRRWHGVSHDAVMNLAWHVTDPPELAELVPFDPRPPALDRRWKVRSARGFLDAARRFARDSGFQRFWEAQHDLLEQTQARFASVLEKEALLAWFDSFFGVPEDLRFYAAPGMLTGGSGYGVSAQVGRTALIHQIIGVSRLDEHELPWFDADNLSTIVHEYCHAFVNPLVHRFEEDLEASGKRIYPYVEDAMELQAYANWKSMVYESLVRAATVQFLELHRGQQAAREEIRVHRFQYSFLWMDELCALLDEYEKNRQRYPSLEALMPRVAALLNDYAGRIGAIVAEREQRKVYWQARVPSVSSEIEQEVAERLERSSKLIDDALSACASDPGDLVRCVREALGSVSFERDIQVWVPESLAA